MNDEPVIGNPYAALGLPSTWKPVQPATNVAEIGVDVGGLPEKRYLLILDGDHGRAAYAYTAEAWRALVDAMLKLATGLEIVR